MNEIRESRKSGETEIEVLLQEKGNSQIRTGIGFFDHLLELFSFHSFFGLHLRARGDLQVDTHHLVEDLGIVLGRAFHRLDKKGIKRFSSLIHPMDETLIQVVVDISGRPYLNWEVGLQRERIGELELETIPEFWQAFVNQARITLHIRKLQGRNEHHILEAVFKGTGRALREAYEQVYHEIPSTKGLID